MNKIPLCSTCLLPIQIRAKTNCIIIHCKKTFLQLSIQDLKNFQSPSSKCQLNPEHSLDGDFFCCKLKKWLCKECFGKAEPKPPHQIIKVDFLPSLKRRLERLFKRPQGAPLELDDLKSVVEHSCDTLKKNYQDLKKQSLSQVSETKDKIIQSFLLSQEHNKLLLHYLKCQSGQINYQNYFSAVSVKENTKFNLELNKDVLIEKYPEYLKTSPIVKSVRYTEKPQISFNDPEASSTITTSSTSPLSAICYLPKIESLSSSAYGQICVYSIRKENFGKLHHTIKAHFADIKSLCLIKENLVSSAYQEIKVWEITEKEYKCVGELKGHSHYITKVISLTHDRICSCSWDKTIKIWEAKPPYKLSQTLLGHSNFVTSIIQLKNREEIISSSYDNTLKYWKDGKCQHTINGIDANGALCQIENRIIIGGIRLKLIDLETKQLICVILNLSNISCFLELTNNDLLCGEEEGGLFVLKHEGMYYPIKENAHKKEIKNLIEVKGRVVSCSVEGVIKFWK